MRLAASLGAAALLGALGLGSASAAPSVTSSDAIGGRTVEQVRLVHKRHYRGTGRRVMGLPTPGTRARYRRGYVPRI